MSASTHTPTRASSPPGDAELTGAPSARRLLREVVAAPEAPLTLDVVGHGGTGKTVLLGVLARCWTERGSRVVRLSGDPTGGTGPDEPFPAGAVLLVDDAHLLAESAVRRLVEHLRTEPTARLVLAHRPWPRPAALLGLAADLAARRAPLTLGELDRSGVAGRVALFTDTRPPAPLVDLVADATGGLPSLVQRLLTALRDAGRLTPDPRLPGGFDTRRLPAGLVEQLSYELDRHPEPVRSLVLALAVGAPLDAEVLGPLLERDTDQVAELVEQTRAAGLLHDAGTRTATLRPVLATALLRRTPAVHRLALRRRLAEVQLERGGSVLTAARDLLDTGATGARVAAVFETAADEALREGSPLAGRFLDAAVAAGAPALGLAARGAEAAARDGDLDRALELADQVLAEADAVGAADRARAVTVAAAACAQRGLLARAAELYRWWGAGAMGSGAVVAVPALIGTGALAEARAVLEPEPAAGGSGGAPGAPPPPPRAPTLLAGAEALLARGVYDTITGSPTAALSQLARAAALLEPAGAAVLLPDSPAALGALVAAHCGELDVARSLLDRAVASGLGGRPAAARHRLLQAWVAMSGGATQTARTLLAEVDARTARLEPRDELVAAALQVGLARRAGDLAALMPAWGRAREAIVRHPVDLYSLQPLGELIVAAARLREQPWVRPHVEEAHALLAALDYPVLWSVSVYWSELHAALAAEDWPEAERHAEALEGAAQGSRYAAAMAVASRSWLAVLRGEVDQRSVEAAARGLHAVGLSWDGGKLAGQGAIRTTDRKAMTALLQCARGLQSSGQVDPPPGPAAGEPDRATNGERRQRPDGDPAELSATDHLPADRRIAPPGPSGRAGDGGWSPTRVEAGRSRGAEGTDVEQSGTLSDREIEVATLVLDGLTYKQIGERLFISAKTVEHHVARMRQRLGATSRAELMARLRMTIS